MEQFKPLEEPRRARKSRWRSRGMVTLLVSAGVVLIVGIVALASMTWASVPPDKIMLHYTGGPIDGTHFVGVVQPGSSTHFYGLLENTYYLPATQRTYIIDKDPDSGDKGGIDSITGVSSDNVTFTFEAATYFKLNPSPAVLRQFFEQICLHDHCTDLSPGGGWDSMLAQYFRPQIENAVRLETGKYDREHLYRDPATLLAMQTEIATILKDRINQSLGGEFFCGPDATAASCPNLTFVLKNPTPPDNVAAAYNDTAASAQKVITAENDAQAAVQRANGERDAQNARAEAAALTAAQIDYIKAQAMLACAQNPSCTLVVTPPDAGVNVNTGSSAG